MLELYEASFSASGVGRFTDQGIQVLANAPSLEEVTFGDPKNEPLLTQAGVSALANATGGRLKVHGWT